MALALFHYEFWRGVEAPAPAPAINLGGGGYGSKRRRRRRGVVVETRERASQWDTTPIHFAPPKPAPRRAPAVKQPPRAVPPVPVLEPALEVGPAVEEAFEQAVAESIVPALVAAEAAVPRRDLFPFPGLDEAQARWVDEQEDIEAILTALAVLDIL